MTQRDPARDPIGAFGAFWLLLGLGALLDLLEIDRSDVLEGVRVLLMVGCLVAAVRLWRRAGYPPETFRSRGLLACMLLAAGLGVASLFAG